MNLQDVMRELRLEEDEENLAIAWEESRSSQPDTMPFLGPDFIAATCRRLLLGEEIIAETLPAARRIHANRALRCLFWHGHHCLFRSPGYSRDTFRRWPPVTTLEKSLREDAGLFYFLLLLSGMPGTLDRLSSFHRAHEVPRDIVEKTIADVGCKLEDYRSGTLDRGYGNRFRVQATTHHTRPAWGLTPGLVLWLLENPLQGNLYRIGRLQFQFSSFGGKLHAYRDRSTGAVLALAGDGVRYRDDGQLASESRSRPCPNRWTSERVCSQDSIQGHPIHPRGTAERRRVRLDRRQWKKMLGPGDPALAVHIPSDGPLDHALCGRSFQQAIDFFGQHFPRRPFAAFCCGSWILDAQLRELLPDSSNMVRFQREVYLFPLLVDDLHLLRRAFHRVPQDLQEAPRDTSLQRALIAHLQAGRKLQARAGGCFLLPGDLDWGRQVYLNQKLP